MKRLLEKWEKLVLIILGVVCAYKMKDKVIEGAFASKRALDGVFSDIKLKVEEERKTLSAPEEKAEEKPVEKAE